MLAPSVAGNHNFVSEDGRGRRGVTIVMWMRNDDDDDDDAVGVIDDDDAVLLACDTKVKADGGGKT